MSNYLNEENKVLRARIPGQNHTKPKEREQVLKLGKVIGRAIEEFITIVSPSHTLPLGACGEEREAKAVKSQGRPA